MLYNPPTGGAANDPYVGKNVAAGIQGSKVPPGAIEFVQREMVALIVASGQSPTNDDLQQGLRAVRSGVLSYYVDAGTADALVITPDPVFSTIADGTEFVVFKGGADNATTTPTLTVNGITMPMVKENASALAVGDLAASSVVRGRAIAGQFRISGLRKSDATGIVHKGTDSSGSAAQLLVADVSPAITAEVDKQMVVVTARIACPGGALTIAFSAGGTAYPVVGENGQPLSANDYAAGDSIILVGQGGQFRLVPTIAQVLRLAQTTTTINATTQIYIDKSVPRGSTKLSAFTSNLIASDIAISPGFTTVQQTGNITGATYVDASSTCALRDNASSGSEGSGTARIALNDVTAGTTTYSNYVGGGAQSQATQIPLVCPRVIFNLDPTHVYNLSLVCQKGGTVGPSQIYDAYIFAQHDGSNQ